MPRYYFDTISGDGFTSDNVGLDLPDDAAAREAAVKALPDIARDEFPAGDHRSFKVIVRNSDTPIYAAELTFQGKSLR